MAFADKLERWYEENGRKLPWRETDNPYFIWLSEIILQQTRIEQGISYYQHFIERYPTIRHLAEASEEEILKSWQGLGYYTRARNLHVAAQYMLQECGGEFPNTYLGISRLKGVGRYTAAAIASFAYKMPYPVIDGNVYRLISRIFCILTPIGTSTAYTQFEDILIKLIDKEHPDIFNQAMMDFGSTFCKPKQPDCPNCIFKQECAAYQQGKVEQLPVKASPVKIRYRYFYYLDIRYNGPQGPSTLVRQRRDDDIWKGLYEFPLIETEKDISEKTLRQKVKEFIKDFTDQHPQKIEILPPKQHKLTHRTIQAVFVRIYFHGDLEKNNRNYDSIVIANIKNIPIPRLIDKYLSSE